VTAQNLAFCRKALVDACQSHDRHQNQQRTHQSFIWLKLLFILSGWCVEKSNSIIASGHFCRIAMGSAGLLLVDSSPCAGQKKRQGVNPAM
jgi:hypothetical protein